MSQDQPRSDRYGPTLVVHLGTAYNSLNENSLIDVEQYLLRAAETPDIKNLVVDLSATSYFGSRFIEALFRAHNRMKRRSGRFALCGLKPYPADVIRISKLDMIWPTFPDADAAVRGLGGQDKG